MKPGHVQNPKDVVDGMKAGLESAGFTVDASSDTTDGAGSGLSTLTAEKGNLSVTFSANGSPDEGTMVQAYMVIKPA